MVSNNVARRVDFLAPGVGVFAVRFHTQSGFAKFLDEYKDALFENTHACRASDANREKVFGVNFTAWANGEDALDTVWDTTDEAPPNEAKTPKGFQSSKSPLGKNTQNNGDVEDEDSDFGDDDESKTFSTPIRTTSGDDALDMKMGALDNSFLIRGNAVDVFRNQAGGALQNADVRINLKDFEGKKIE